MKRIIVDLFHPSGVWIEAPVSERLAYLKTQDLEVRYHQPILDPEWPWTSSNPKYRAHVLKELLDSNESLILWAARGGYGCSDLFSMMNFEELSTLAPRTLIGFSDITALQAAFWTQLGWKSIHGPMPLTQVWGHKDAKGIKETINVIQGKTGQLSHKISACGPLSQVQEGLEGLLLGGCLSVLSSLIGTKFQFKTIDPYLLFLEDINESPGQVLRHLRHWQQSDQLKKVAGIIVGCFSEESIDETPFWSIIEKEFQIPIFQTKSFGHHPQNFPLVIGAQAQISVDHKVLKIDTSDFQTPLS